MSTLTSSLIVRLVDRVSRPARGVTNSLLGIQRVGANANRMSFGDRLAAGIRRNDAAIANARGGLIDAAAGFYALRAAIASPVRAAMQFESAMADVRKVVDFPTPEAFVEFKRQLQTLSHEVPVAAGELASIAAAAGEIGIAGEELIPFTRTAAQMGVAFGISAEEAGRAMATFRGRFGLAHDEVIQLGDAVNYLSNRMAANAPDITNTVERAGALAFSAGASAEAMAALAAAFNASSRSPEIAATGMQNFLLALSTADTASDRAQRAFASLGLDAGSIAQQMQEDFEGTTFNVLERIAALPEEAQLSSLTAIFGRESIQAIAPLLENLGILSQAFEMVSDEGRVAGSMMEEYTIRAATFGANLQRFNNRLTSLQQNIGNALLPALTAMLDAISPLVERVTALAQAHPKLIANVVAATAALVAFRSSVAALRFAGLLGRGGALGMLSFAINGVSRSAITTARLLGAPFAPFAAHVTGVFQTVALRSRMMFAALRSGSIGAGGALAGMGATMSRALLSFLNPMSLVRGAFIALRTAMIASGIGAIVVGIATAGTWIYNNWSGIAAMFAGIGEGIRDAFGPAAPIIDAVSAGVERLFGWFSNLTGPINATEEQWREFGVQIGETIGGAISTAIERFNAFVEWVRGLPSRVVEAIGSIDLSEIGERAVNSIRTTLGEMRETGRFAIERLQIGMHQRFQLLLHWAGEIPGQMIGAISSLAAVMLTAGRNAIQSLWDGAVEEFESFIEWVRGIPSRIADEIGAINLFETVSSGFGGLFGAENEEEPPTFTARPENAGASPEVAAATSVLEAVRASRQLPTERMAELAAEAEHYRYEIAELQAQLGQLVDTPIMNGWKAQAETELGLLRRDLASVEADMEAAQTQESELRAALNLLSDTEVLPEIDMTSMDRALARVQALSSALNGLSNSSVAGVSTPTVDGARASGGPVRAGGTYLVGERGAELITPTRSGFVHTARDTTRMLQRIRSGFLPANANGDEVFHGLASAISEASGLTSPRETAAASPRRNGETAQSPAINLTLSGPIVQGLSIANGWDPERVAREVAQRIEQDLAQTMRGLHADFV